MSGTACKRMEDALREANRMLRTYARVVDNSPDFISLVDRHYVYRMVNPAYARLNGIPVDEFEGRTPAHFLGEEIFQKVIRPELDQCFAGQPVHYEAWFTYAAAGRRCMEVHYYPLFGDGQVEYAVVVGRDITERKQAEEERIKLAQEQAARAEAEAAQRRINNILESITDAFFALDREWRFTYVNREAERLLRKKRDELLGKNVWEEFPDALDSTFYTQYHTVASEQVPVVFEAFYPPYAIWVEVHAYPSEDGLSVYFHDITGRKRAEEATARLAAIVESSNDAIIGRTLGGTITSWNPAAERLFGHGAGDAVGKSLSIIVPPDRADELLETLGRTREGERIEQLETVRVRKDGQRVDVSLAISPIRDAVGRIIGASTIARDITERKRAERERERLLAEVQRQAAELDATLVAIADPVAIFDAAGKIIRANPAGKNVVGYTPEELELPLAEQVALLRLETADGKPLPIDQAPVARALRGETVRGVILAMHPPRTDRTVWSITSAAPICLPDGRLLGAVTVATDITALHELQEWLQDLIRTVSHDLRNPLTVIQGHALLLVRLLDRAGRQGAELRSAQAIVAGARQMDAMIQDLVESARLESGQLRLEKRPVDLKTCVAELLDRTREVLEVGRIKVEVPEGLPPVWTDPDRLERILVNLISNALKYSPPHTEVLIRAERAASEVTVSVTDRGAGIAPENLPHLFERFFRARGTAGAEGLGLGLYITKMLVEAQGGRLWVDSEPGKGSTFCFTLPST
ncbi:MAG: PAS domain S-box protein [Chloroflexi bacterium]|nr:PAS domain S-box protein [Chloroflexota bacterium]